MLKTKEQVKAGADEVIALSRLDDKYCKTAEWLRRRIVKKHEKARRDGK